jgi:DNA-binding CsgD family transcriptional regulator
MHMGVLQNFFHTKEFENLVFNNATGFTIHKYIKDIDGDFYACENQIKAAGFDHADEVLGLNDFDIVKPREAHKIRHNDKEVIYTRQPKVIVEHVTSFNGKSLIATSFKTNLQSQINSKKIIGIIGLSIIQELKPEDQNHQNIFNLTTKEMQCLFCLVRGLSVKQISTELFLSSRTIEHYMENIKIKLNCRVRSELIAKALAIPQIRERVQRLLM